MQSKEIDSFLPDHLPIVTPKNIRFGGEHNEIQANLSHIPGLSLISCMYLNNLPPFPHEQCS